LATGAGVAHEPAEREGRGAAGLDLDRNLVGRATDTAGLDLEGRLDVLERALERDDRVVAGLLAQTLHGAVDDALGGGALAVQQHLVDQGGYQWRTVERVDDDRALRGGT